MNSQEEKAKRFKKMLTQFWRDYEQKIILAVGMILVGIISFQAGMLIGQKWQAEPLVVEVPFRVVASNPNNNTNNTIEPTNINEKNSNDKRIDAISNKNNCVFVGSKNSNKYHVPSCRWAKQIKPENLVCFSSAEDAEAKNYQPDKNCIK